MQIINFVAMFFNALLFNFDSVVRLLVQKENSIVKSEDEDSNTPLHIAAIHGHNMVGEILLEYGADVCAKY